MSSISEFLRIFRDSLCREKLTKLDAKCAKRSVKMWTTDFYQNFFKNSLLYMTGQLSKNCSGHTYVMHRMFYFELYCMIQRFLLDWLLTSFLFDLSIDCFLIKLKIVLGMLREDSGRFIQPFLYARQKIYCLDFYEEPCNL